MTCPLRAAMYECRTPSPPRRRNEDYSDSASWDDSATTGFQPPELCYAPARRKNVARMVMNLPATSSVCHRAGAVPQAQHGLTSGKNTSWSHAVGEVMLFPERACLRGNESGLEDFELVLGNEPRVPAGLSEGFESAPESTAVAHPVASCKLEGPRHSDAEGAGDGEDCACRGGAEVAQDREC